MGGHSRCCGDSRAHLAPEDTEAHTEEAALSRWLRPGPWGPGGLCRWLGARQVPVEVEAEEAGEQLAGCCPPDEEGEDGAEE